jgi:putative endonuclease
MKWFLYIVTCSDGTLYTGITTDIQRRIEEHNALKGAKYVRGKVPVKLVYSEEYATMQEAARREWVVKKMRRADKLKLIKG